MKHEQTHQPPQHNTEQHTIPPVPLTRDDSGILHQMFRLRWPAWKALSTSVRQEVTTEAAALFDEWKHGEAGQSGLFSTLGHKGDLMVLHFRRSFDGLNEAELRLAHTNLAEFL